MLYLWVPDFRLFISDSCQGQACGAEASLTVDTHTPFSDPQGRVESSMAHPTVTVLLSGAVHIPRDLHKVPSALWASDSPSTEHDAGVSVVPACLRAAERCEFAAWGQSSAVSTP